MLGTKLILAAAGNAAEEGYQISRSLRFNSADSAYLNRTFSASNRKTFTYSLWVKKAKNGTDLTLLDVNAGSAGTPRAYFSFSSSDALNVGFNPTGSAWISLYSTQVFRDPSSWYHIILSVDTTQATSSDRTKLYVNGIQITSFGTEQYPTQNTDLPFNASYVHYIGRTANNLGYLDGYMADIHFVDGQALTADDFGETDETTGVWKPKAYAGTYGTNGFHLDFSDNTSTTTIGYDAAGSNNWTANNISVTAGAGNDSLVDTPTPYGVDTGAGGEVRGNYCTLNPLATVIDTLSNGNLNWVGGIGSTRITKSTFGVSSGKWYAEFTYTGTNNGTLVGINPPEAAGSGGVPTVGVSYAQWNGNKYINGSNSAYGATWTTNDVIGIALDLDADEVTFYKNNSSQGAISISSGGTWNFHCIGSNASDTGNWNFGQRPFAYTAPSGFKALCTQNLPTPTIADGSEYFNTVLYTGNGTTQSITGVGFQPDWVWIKSRSSSVQIHQLYDAIRGINEALFTDATDAETTTNALTAFGSDGFTVSWNASYGGTNTSTGTYVAWNWNAGGSNATNTDGTITSTVRANTTAGFSVITATTPASGSFTIGHGLGVAPKMVIIKGRETAGYSWSTYHSSVGAGSYLYLNSTIAATASATIWDNTSPSSSLIYGTAGAWGGGEDYVIYAFAEVEGYSKFGSYTGNGSADGPFVYCGFRPAFVMFKRSDSTGNWSIIDTTRDTYNATQYGLYPNLSNAESSPGTMDILSNGLKIRTTIGDINVSTGTYIFAAFAENPFKYSLAR